MITVLMGDNSYEVRAALDRIINDFSGTPERFYGESLSLEQLADVFGGNTLFATERLVIIRDLSKQAALWGRLSDWLERIADTTHVVLVEDKLDKRTASYKALKSAGAVKEFAAWTDKDRLAVQRWVSERAKALGLSLQPALAARLVERVGLDQWQLESSLQKLSLLDEVTAETIDEYTDANPSENVFQLFELALKGDHAQLSQALRTLKATEEPYAIFALLSSQVVQLAAIAAADEASDPAKEFGIHPFVVSKLKSTARQQKGRISRIVRLFAKADVQLKTTSADPWQIIEKTLYSF